MGWNQGWSIMEDQVIDLYDLGVLTKPVLVAVLRPFYDTDADSGGASYRATKDDKEFAQVVVEIMRPDFKPEPVEADEHGYIDDPWTDELFDLLSDRSAWFPDTPDAGQATPESVRQ